MSIVTNNFVAVTRIIVSLRAEQNKPWLIDWEYTAQRQAAYNLLVFVIKSCSKTQRWLRVFFV